MVWIYAGVIALVYGFIFLFRDDASENIRKWAYPILLILAIGGGLYFANHGTNDDDECTTYGHLTDC